MTTVKSPEKLTGHDLVNYLTANPDTKGNFKWNSLLSCMWRNLLIAQPGFETVADFNKINAKDAYRILLIHPKLAQRFNWKKIRPDDILEILIKYPELASKERTSSFRSLTWSNLLKKRPELSYLCDFNTFYTSDWVNLVSRQISMAKICPWDKFTRRDWEQLVSIKKNYLKFLKYKHLHSLWTLWGTLKKCYFDKPTQHQGLFEQEISDISTFMIFKHMDKENGRRFLKHMYDHNEYQFRCKYPETDLDTKNWDFIEELCKISPEEAMDVHGKKYMPFHITLVAPDKVFEKLFPLFDLTARDPGGNSLLMAALLFCWHHITPQRLEDIFEPIRLKDAARYKFLLSQGLDPDEKNFAGFSCNDVIKRFNIEIL